jgi:ADP-heptose:LPS heptosyltransferase
MRVLKLQGNWTDYDYSKLRVDGKSVCIVRYGAFGDMMQTSSILPALKEQGYHITLNVSPYGADVIRNDPHIDCLFIQENELVPNEKLADYWGALSAQFDKFINLSESIERSLLAYPGDKAFDWVKDFRDLVMGRVDYLDATHTIAGLMEYPKRPKFYPSAKEVKWSQDYRTKLGKLNKVILWVLSGSSVHKYYPGMDAVIARLLLYHPEIRIVMVGDSACRLIECAWINEPRIKLKSGTWSIRESLAFMQQCDLVVGTETGILNAAAYEQMKKVIILSHSSPDNLGGSWSNTSVIIPKECDCYPCHKIHYGWETCRYDETSGGALCMSRVDPDEVYKSISEAL